MIRALMTVLVLSVGSIAFAAPECNTHLVLSCQATYLNQGKTLDTLTAADSFADENWDEPSLANCASTVYIAPTALPHTSVRIYASKDLSSNAVAVSTSASQYEDTVVDGVTYRSGGYSNTNEAAGTTGHVFNLGTLHLPKAAVKGQTVVTDISVICTVK